MTRPITRFIDFGVEKHNEGDSNKIENELTWLSFYTDNRFGSDGFGTYYNSEVGGRFKTIG